MHTNFNYKALEVTENEKLMVARIIDGDDEKQNSTSPEIQSKVN